MPPMQPQPPVPPMPPMLPAFHRLAADFPPPGSDLASRIEACEATPGHQRHDLLVDQGMMSHLIGAGGKTHKEMTARTGCSIFILDKEIPPGVPPGQRLVVLVGSPHVVSAAAFDILDRVQKQDIRLGRKNPLEVSMLPPPLPSLPLEVSMLPPPPAMSMLPPPPASLDLQMGGNCPVPFEKRTDGWAESTLAGAKIVAAEAVPGVVRHDVLVAKDMCGVLIGTGGAVYKQLCSSTGAKVIIIDSEAPPNEAADVRLVVLVGPPACVTAANAQVEHLIRTASEKRGQKRGFDGVSQLQPPSCYG